MQAIAKAIRKPVNLIGSIHSPELLATGRISRVVLILGRGKLTDSTLVRAIRVLPGR